MKYELNQKKKEAKKEKLFEKGYCIDLKESTSKTKPPPPHTHRGDV